MSDRWLAAPGLSLCVAETGEGQPMLFQHGLCGDAAQTADVFPAGIGWRCATLECRGHGESDLGPRENLSIAQFSDDLAALIAARGWAPVVLGGISMGAALALRIAVRRPELVRALVLARPAWVADSDPPNMRPNAEVGELLARLPANEALEQFEASGTARRLASEAPDNLASLRGFFTREPAAATSALLSRLSRDGPGVTAREIAAIAVPALVIATERDAIHPLAHARDLAVLIPRAQLVQITAKADSREGYRRDFRSALAAFLTEISP